MLSGNKAALIECMPGFDIGPGGKPSWVYVLKGLSRFTENGIDVPAIA